MPEQRAIADFLDRETAGIDGLVAKVKEAIERLQEYRTALITAAVTGKIDVREKVMDSVDGVDEVDKLDKLDKLDEVDTAGSLDKAAKALAGGERP
jgi:hypothetical protein